MLLMPWNLDAGLTLLVISRNPADITGDLGCAELTYLQGDYA